MSLAVKNLDYEIGNERILDQISLEIKEGEFVGLVGPNGCGKSTLLKHIYRTYKPKGQTVFLDGKDIMDLSAKKLAGELAVMAQENQLEFDFTVRDMVMFGRYAHKKFLEGDTAKDRELCEKCLREVGLSGYETRSYLSLSGGEKQRVLLARVLMQESRYIVLDEPTNGLDPNQIVEVRNLIREIASDRTVLLSTHILSEVQATCLDIKMIECGRVVFSGTVDDFDNYIKPNTLLACFERPPLEDELLAVEGITKVKKVNEKNYRLWFDGGRDVSKDVVKCSVKNGWELEEIRFEKSSLDAVFAKLSNKEIREL